MLKKPITFDDLEGKPVTEEFWFHLSKADLIRMEMSAQGGMSDFLEKLVSKQDGKTIIAMFEDMILSSVGERSPDGKQFIKNDDIRNYFRQTNAYSELLVELVNDPNAAATFANGIMPKNLDDVAKTVSNTETAQLPQPDETPAWIRENREPTQAEFQSMTKDQLLEAFRRKNTPDPE
ncbi:MAG: hypothetical protein JWO15_3518 [Sphingomonadales bacterium]|nr:hypothetical protein [Sphingomonadales bacterium]